MKRTILGVAALALVFTASAAEAQRPVQFGVAAGASMPMGDFGDAAETGWHAGVVLGLSMPTAPVGVRIDGMYNSFGFAEGIDETWNIISVTANATWGLPMAAAPLSPYLIGGLGMYRLGTSIEDTDAETDFGFNVGAGVKFNLQGFGTFIEARYNSVQSEGDLNYLPITFGIMF